MNLPNILPFGKPRATPARGFTLLEMVFVLGLLMIMVTWVTVSIATVDTQKELRQAAGDIETLARRARALAIKQQRSYQITISEDSISISPLYPRPEGSEEDEPETRRHPDISASEKTDPDVTYEVRRWMSDEWIEIEGDNKVTLVLDSIGLCEPISIRCTRGNSWIIQELHPLTAMVRDEEMSISKDD